MSIQSENVQAAAVAADPTDQRPGRRARGQSRSRSSELARCVRLRVAPIANQASPTSMATASFHVV